ncbi:MAG: vWA domain-containing protein [Planctomycetota bacterium]|jgi:hypothetical protein
MIKKSTALCMVLVAIFAGAAPADITGSIIPNSISPVLSPGQAQAYTFDYCANITPGSGKADVLFLTDSTGSMGAYISGISDAFGDILSTIATGLPGIDVHYGVADYKDYRDGGDYRDLGLFLRQPFTSDTAAVDAAIADMYAVGGYDLPESQLKAFVNLANNWMTPSGGLGFNGRPDAQKLIIWAGDVEGHYYGEGGDGPPEHYPVLSDTLDALNAQGIRVFGLNLEPAQNGIDVDAGGANQATYLTEGTGGGLTHNLNLSPTGIQEKVVDAVMQGVEVLSNITLAIENEGVLVDHIAQTSIIGNWNPGDGEVCDSFTFEITGSDEPGVTDFEMVLLVNGAEADRVSVHLTTVPEPTTVLLLGFGGLGLLRKRKV